MSVGENRRLNSKKRYLICGIPVSSSGGVGRLLRALLPLARKHNYHIIVPGVRQGSIKQALRERDFFTFVKLVFLRIFYHPDRVFKLKCRFVRNSTVIYIHPQITGFDLLFRILRKNRVFIYLMDNSFFCIRSYNFHPTRRKECLDCLGLIENADVACTPFPVAYDRELNLQYLRKLMVYSDRIYFLAQNRLQKEIVERHFPSVAGIRVVGLNLGDLDLSNELLDIGVQADFVYHGAAILPKGIEYFIGLARFMPEKSFFVPASKEECEKALDSEIVIDNIQFRECTWETGLAYAVERATMVFNPSLWSAPIEGALIKSLYHAALVVVVETEFGFESEIADLPGVIRLPRDCSAAAQILKSVPLNDYRIERKERLASMSISLDVFLEVEAMVVNGN